MQPDRKLRSDPKYVTAPDPPTAGIGRIPISWRRYSDCSAHRQHPMPRAVVAQATAENRRLLAAAGRSVLLVTDDIVLERVCSNVLLHAGCHVSVARHSGHALLACLSGTCPDLLIAELSMPD